MAQSRTQPVLKHSTRSGIICRDTTLGWGESGESRQALLSLGQEGWRETAAGDEPSRSHHDVPGVPDLCRVCPRVAQGWEVSPWTLSDHRAWNKQVSGHSDLAEGPVCPSISRTPPEPSWWNVAYIQLILDQSSKAGRWGSGERHTCEDPWAGDHITTGHPICSPPTRLRECDQCPPALWGSNSSQRQWNGPVAPRPFLDPQASIFNSSTKHNGICDPSILLSWLF